MANTERSTDSREVLLRTFHDPVLADVAIDFLRQHGVDVVVRGHSGAVNVLPHVIGAQETRLYVAEPSLPLALEVLGALTPPRGSVIDAREPGVEDELRSGDPYRAIAVFKEARLERRRSRVAAVPLAMLLPIGSGHFYAGHMVTGALLAFGIVGCFVASFLPGAAWLVHASVLMVLGDAALASRAVERANKKAVSGDVSQAVTGVSIVLAAIAVAGAVHHANRSAASASAGTVSARSA